MFEQDLLFLHLLVKDLNSKIFNLRSCDNRSKSVTRGFNWSKSDLRSLVYKKHCSIKCLVVSFLQWQRHSGEVVLPMEKL